MKDIKNDLRKEYIAFWMRAAAWRKASELEYPEVLTTEHTHGMYGSVVRVGHNQENSKEEDFEDQLDYCDMA